MTRSSIPDPLQLLRDAVNKLEGRLNDAGTRGLQMDAVIKALQRVNSFSLVLRQAMEGALDNHYKRLNLPTARDIADIKVTLQHIEDQLESLSNSHSLASAAPRPARTRKPPALARTEPAAAAAPETTAAPRRATPRRAAA